MEAIRQKGNRAPEPNRNIVFSDNVIESASYRKKSSDVFNKANEATLSTISDLKPFAQARCRKKSISTNMLNCTLNDS